MTTQTSASTPSANLAHTMHVYLGATGKREGDIFLTYEEHQRANREMMKVDRGPDFFAQVTDQKTGKRYDLYRAQCGGDCWCAVRAKQAKAVLARMEHFESATTGKVIFTLEDKTLTFRAPHDEYTRMLLEDKPHTYVYLLMGNKSYEIIYEVEDPK